MRWFKGVVLFLLNAGVWLAVASMNAPATELAGKAVSTPAPAKSATLAESKRQNKQSAERRPELLQDQGAIWQRRPVSYADKNALVCQPRWKS